MAHDPKHRPRFDVEAFIDAIALPVAAVDLDGRLLYWNAANEKMTGRPRSEVVGMHATDLVMEPYRDRVRALLGARGDWSGRLVAERPDGRLLPVSAAVRPLRSSTGEVTALVGVGFDISGELGAEARFRSLFESASIGIGVGALDGTIVEWNPALAQMLGYDADALPLHNSQITHPDDLAREQELMAPVLAGRSGGYRMEKRYIRKDGTIVWGSLRTTVVRGPDERMICALGLVEDISERKQMEEAVRESDRQNRELVVELRDLASHVAGVREEEQARVAREIHDELGQRLTALKLDVAWLRKKSEGTSLAEMGPICAEKLDAMGVLLDDTLRSMRSLIQELRPAVLDDLGLAAAVEWQVQRFTENTGIPCHLDVTIPAAMPPCPRDVVCFRIVQEALTNVARHAGAKNVWIRLRLDGGLRLEVRDDGVGIAEGERARASMGIVGMRERARALGGVVEVRRGPDAGTVLTADLPSSGAPS